MSGVQSDTVRSHSTRGVAYQYTIAVSRAELLRTAVEQLLSSFGADEVERQHLAEAVRHGVRAFGRRACADRGI
jgi:hypothetical protein